MDSKLPDIGTTIFTVMSQLAHDCGAINLSQGYPEFDPDPALLERVFHYLQNGANQYAPMAGVPALRQAIAAKIGALYGRKCDPDTEITVCTGASEGIFSAVTATVRRGDEVIVFDPVYDSYEPAVRLCGGLVRHVPLRYAGVGRFAPDWQGLADAVNDRTRLIMLNFPHNPTGAILSPGDLDTLADILRDREIYVVSDEVYEHLVFDGESHQSLLRHDELWPRTFAISSFGKTYHATGWKIGYCAAPAGLTTEFRRVHQFNTFTVMTPMQHAIADFMVEKPDYYQDLVTFYEKKRDVFAAFLAKSRLRLVPAASTFFQLVDYSAISDENDVELARRLTREIGVASIPVSVFYAAPPGHTLLRLCFAKDDDTLEEAATRVCRL